MLDCTYRVQIPHQPGQLAQVAAAIADAEGLIGDVVTVAPGREHSVREITVEVRDLDQAEEVADRIGGRVHPGRGPRVPDDRRAPGAGGALHDDRPHRRHLHQRDAGAGAGQHRPGGLDAGDGGQAVCYRQFAGLSAIPILIDTADVATFVETVIRIAPTFGGIHLEDISAPECFEIERRLIGALDQPVMHDDVHGTAVVCVAAVIAACRYAGLDLAAASSGSAPPALASPRSWCTAAPVE